MLGLVLSRLVVSVVSVSAETTTPVPPLVTDPAWGTAAVGLAVLVAPGARAHGADGSARATGTDPFTWSVDARMTPAIELSDAFRIYGSGPGATVALQGLDLAVAPGEIVVVLGPSGAGKSTLLRVLAGLERLTAGTARVLGTDLGLLDDAGAAAFRAAHVGLLDQHYARSLSPDLTCRHTVALQLQLLGAPPAESLADGGRAARARRPRCACRRSARVALGRRAAARRRLRRRGAPAGAAPRRRAGRRARRRQRGGRVPAARRARARRERDGPDREPRLGRRDHRRPAGLHPRRADRRGGPPRLRAARS